MPNPFRVGDRVRRIGLIDYINASMPNGTIWTVSALIGDASITVENDPVPRGSRCVGYFELVEPPVVVERVYTFYLIVYEYSNTAILSARRDSEQAATRVANRIIRDGGTVHAKKKITVRY